MKSTKLLPVAAALLTPLLTQCLVVEQNDPGATGANQAPAGFTQPLNAVTSQGGVTIREGGRTLSYCRTAMPNVETTRWHKEQEQLVVKSRGNHGPATVQLFDSRTGRQQGRVMAYEIRGGKPGWAAGLGE
jgi:hypothetical protein